MEETGLPLLLSLARRLSYKPGHRFGVTERSSERALVWLGCEQLPNAEAGGRPLGIRVYHEVLLQEVLRPSDALTAFTAVVAKFELHEAAEFLRIDGATVFLPHRAGAERGDITWSDFTGLSGRWLRALDEGLSVPREAPASRDT